MNTIIGYTNNRTHAAWCASDRTVISHWKRCKFARPDDIIVIVNNDIKCVVLVAYIAGTCSDTPCSIYAGEDSKYNAHPIPIRDYRLVNVPVNDIAAHCGIGVHEGNTNIHKPDYHGHFKRIYYHPSATSLADTATVLQRYTAYMKALLDEPVVERGLAARVGQLEEEVSELKARVTELEAQLTMFEAREARRRELPVCIALKDAELTQLQTSIAACPSLAPSLADLVGQTEAARAALIAEQAALNCGSCGSGGDV